MTAANILKTLVSLFLASQLLLTIYHLNPQRAHASILPTICPEGNTISYELCSAWKMPPPTIGDCKIPLLPQEKAVLSWLQHYAPDIIAAEKLWHVDRRAIAGAIAWEALQNPDSFIKLSLFGAGPGKVHAVYYSVKQHLNTLTLSGNYHEITVAEEIEHFKYFLDNDVQYDQQPTVVPADVKLKLANSLDNQKHVFDKEIGLLSSNVPPLSSIDAVLSPSEHIVTYYDAVNKRKALLSDPVESIKYIAAIMSAFESILLNVGGYDISHSPDILVSIINREICSITMPSIRPQPLSK